MSFTTNVLTARGIYIYTLFWNMFLCNVLLAIKLAQHWNAIKWSWPEFVQDQLFSEKVERDVPAMVKFINAVIASIPIWVVCAFLSCFVLDSLTLCNSSIKKVVQIYLTVSKMSTICHLQDQKHQQILCSSCAGYYVQWRRFLKHVWHWTRLDMKHIPVQPSDFPILGCQE